MFDTLKVGKVIITIPGSLLLFLFLLRWLNQRLISAFAKSGLEFHAQYVNCVRNWANSMERLSTLSGAYRKRRLNDTKDIPHSFTFVRRDSPLAQPATIHVNILLLDFDLFSCLEFLFYNTQVCRSTW